MRLLDLVGPKNVKVDLDAASPEEAVEELLAILVERGALAAAACEGVLNAVLERERARSTGMENGVALPHGTVRDLPGVVAAVGTSRAGIEWSTLDGQRVRIVVLVAIPQSHWQVHVKTLAGIARLLCDSEFRDAILAAETAADAFAVLKAADEANGHSPKEPGATGTGTGTGTTNDAVRQERP